MNNDKFQFSSVAKWVIGLLITALVVFLVWYFRFLVGCVLVALVLAFMGAPIQKFLSKIRFKRFCIGKTISATITLILFILVFVMLFRWLVPLIISPAMTFANLDVYKIADYYAEPIKKIETF